MLRHIRYMVIAAIYLLTAACGPAAAQQDDAHRATEIRGMVEKCFTPPDGATEQAVIAVTFNADGSLGDSVEIVSKGAGAVNDAYANAARRAILRCSAGLSGLGITGKVTLNFNPSAVVAGAPAENSSSAALSPERLQGMQQAADQLTRLFEQGVPDAMLDPSAPGIAKLLGVLCRPQEAEQLQGTSTAQYREVSQYAKQVSTVMEVYDTPPALKTQAQVNRNIRLLAACVDATLWSNLAAFEMSEKILSQDADLSSSPDAKRIREKLLSSTVDVIDGALESFRLDDIGAGWCEQRITPLVALTRTAAVAMSTEQKEALRKDASLGERCGPATKLQLQPLYEILAQ